MTLLASVPGDIPGLLIRGARVRHARLGFGVVVDPPAATWARVLLDGCEDTPDPLDLSDLSLDLTEPIGRAIGWMWLDALPLIVLVETSIRAVGMTAAERKLILDLARDWRDMTPTQIDRFARLILAVQP